MWSSAQALVNYGEAVGTMIVAGALADWSLGDAQRRWLGDHAARVRALVDDVRRRRLLDLLCHPRLQRNLVAMVFLADAVLVSHLAHRVAYRGSAATVRDILLGELLLFIVPLGVAAVALFKAGPRLVTLLVGRGNLPGCSAKCVAAALATGVVAYGALQVIDATYVAFGPRARLDWWDARLLLYAAEYALCGMIVSAMMIIGLLVVLLGAGGLALLVVVLALLQVELLAGLIARWPRGALLGSSIAVAGLAIMIKDRM